MKRDAGSCLGLELQMILTCSLLNVALPGANADFFSFFPPNVFVGETEEDGSTCVFTPPTHPPTHPPLDVKATQPLFSPALSLRGCAAAAARSDHMRSISRQECARGGASLDEELCGAWPAAAEHMARTSCGLLLMASAACAY